MNRPRLAAVLLAVTTVAMSACGGADTNRPSADAATTTASPVVALTSIEQFAAAFNADNGTPRVIMPISPT